MKPQVGQFVQFGDRMGIVVANDTMGGVYRGHVDIWFGEVRNLEPVIEEKLYSSREKDWKFLERPMAQ